MQDDNPFMSNDLASSQSEQNPFISEDTNPNPANTQGAGMDFIDAFNNRVNSLASGALQGIAKAINAVGIDTSNFQNKLAASRAVFQKAGEEAAQRSPKAAFAGEVLGDIANIAYTSAATGGLGTTNAAPTVLGRMTQQGALAGLESASE